MKAKNLFFIALAGAALCACSSEDLLSDGSGQKVFEGDKAYMTVSIKDVGSMSTRATGANSNEGFKYGTSKEYAVDNAHFYFYDKEGNYVSAAEVWDDGEHTETNPNIDFNSNTVIVLKGLTSRVYPNYMVTVLNQPSGFEPAETLDEMQTELASKTDLAIMLDEENQTNFTISTTSYKRDGVDGYYFVTPLATDNFYEDPVEANEDDANAVQVYVERLAAKVTVRTSLEGTTLDDGTILYQINATVAGDDNNDDPDSEDPDKSAVGDDANLYVKLLGWKLDATAKYSNIVKNLGDADWTEDGIGFAWNDADHFRSYWGESFNYSTSEDEYTKSNVDADGNLVSDGTTLNDYLDYTDLNDLTSLGSDYYEYCGENTHDATMLSSKYSPAITTVLLSAQICDEDGNGLNIVRYNGELFTRQAYLNEALRDLTTSGDLNAYYLTKDDANNDVYKHIDAAYVDLETMGDGKVKVVLDAETLEDIEGDLYKKSEVLDENGNEQFTKYTDNDLADIQTALDTWNETADANAYKDGMMYYLIPIEHLDNNTNTSGALLEANYGVVRNHHYVLTITELENLGRGVFDPDEIIVPNPEEYNDEFYHVRAVINILSWKLVEQDVKL
ncbi:MAG: Mfa1 family fimbria major subunit [Prevotellaceae bacterium]|nr:Mfa1 family fimbria major subunit [Prevotellaceae bacterium]